MMRSLKTGWKPGFEEFEECLKRGPERRQVQRVLLGT